LPHEPNATVSVEGDGRTNVFDRSQAAEWTRQHSTRRDGHQLRGFRDYSCRGCNQTRQPTEL